MKSSGVFSVLRGMCRVCWADWHDVFF